MHCQSIRRCRRPPAGRHLLLKFCCRCRRLAASHRPFNSTRAGGSRGGFHRPALCRTTFPTLGTARHRGKPARRRRGDRSSAFLGTDDDHTLLYAISAVFTVHPITQQKLPYNPVRDLVPISPTSDVVLAIAASEKNSIRSLDDLVRTARAQPGKLNWAASPGLPPFVTGGFFKSSKLDLAFVSYRDVSPALQDLGEGRIDVFVHALGVIMPQVQSGRARLLAVASDVRVPLAPDVPTVTEAGFPELRMDGVVGFYGKRGLPDTLRDRIASDVRAVASDPDVRERLAAVGQTARPGTAADFAALLDQYRRRLADLAKTIDFKATQ